MRPIPANCPAEVRFVIEINTAIQTGNPELTAIIPKVKDTERYPNPIGIPSLIPDKKLFDNLAVSI
jgi:hypothetical protein